MLYKIYKTPDPNNRLDTSVAYEKGIADLLFDFEATMEEGLHTIVTSPARTKAGFNVIACQSYFQGEGNAAYVLVPESQQLYSFTKAVLPVKDVIKSFLKTGLKGLLSGAEEEGIICRAITEDDDDWLSVCASPHITQDNWYHFTGTPQEILKELQKKCSLILK